jgi:hypothetical protein
MATLDPGLTQVVGSGCNSSNDIGLAKAHVREAAEMHTETTFYQQNRSRIINLTRPPNGALARAVGRYN